MATDGFPISGDTITEGLWQKLVEAQSPIGFVVSGLVVTDIAGNNVAVAAGAAVVNGVYFDIDANASLAVTASATRYIYLTRTGGTLNYNMAATMPTDAGSTLLAKVVTDGSGNSTITDFRKRTPFHRGSSVVVAASNASMWSKSGADYICDGTADQAEINAAIGLLTAFGQGGSVELTEGTFNLTAEITMNLAQLTLCGQGNETLLETETGTMFAINITAAECCVRALKVANGAAANTTGVVVSAAFARITDCSFSGIANAVYTYPGGTYCVITGNTVLSVANGVELSEDYATVTGNAFYDCSYYCVDVQDTVDRATVTGNAMRIRNGAYTGILCGGDNVTITGNSMYGATLSSTKGIVLTSASANCCVVANCTIGTGGISNAGSNNYVASNS